MCDLWEPGAEEQCVSTSTAGQMFLSVLCGTLNSRYSPLVILQPWTANLDNHKSLGEKAGPAVSQHRETSTRNTFDVNSHLCFFIPSEQKAAPGTPFTKDRKDPERAVLGPM